MAPVLKTGVPERVSGVRIPPLPPFSLGFSFSGDPIWILAERPARFRTKTDVGHVTRDGPSDYASAQSPDRSTRPRRRQNCLSTERRVSLLSGIEGPSEPD